MIQILVGIIWGKPLGNWLDQTAQKVIMDLGYLGLILLVYQGDLFILPKFRRYSNSNINIHQEDSIVLSNNSFLISRFLH